MNLLKRLPTMLNKQRIIPVIAGFLLLGLSGTILLNINRTDKLQQHFQQHTEMLEVSYRAAIHTYQVATEIYLRDTINQPEVLTLFSQAWKADERHKAVLRRQLYQLLQPSYSTLWQNRLRQLHFHLPDGESFLRFHQTDRFGDKLFSVRPSVRIANTQHLTVIGFEAGRIIDGFRYVYPLFHQNRHIGSIETSIPFRSVQSAMQEFTVDHEYQCLLNAELIQERLFPDFTSHYIPAPLAAGFLLENPARKHPDSAISLSPAATAITAKLRKDSDIAVRLAAGKPFSVGVIEQGIGYVVSFLPIIEVTGTLGSYIVSFAKEPLVVSMQQAFYVELIVFLTLLALAFWLLHRWRGSMAELAQQTARQEYDSELLNLQERVERDERTRISRDLHDGVSQSLQAIKLNLNMLYSGMQRNSQVNLQVVGQLLDDLQHVSAELRNIILSLRPSPLSGMGIDEAVRWLCTNLEKQSGVPIHLQIAGEFEAVGDKCSLTIFRICQEALANIMKHAAADRVQVVLSRDVNRITLTVTDNGKGGASPVRPDGSGLAIMQERVNLAGGRLLIESPPGQGTRIFVELQCR